MERFIVSARKYEELSLGEIKKSGLSGTILSEPMPKNTAAAVLYAAMFLKKGSCRGEGYPPLTSWLSLCYDWVLAR